MNRPENRDKTLILIGFTDSSGDPFTNLELSNRRALSVGRWLEPQDIKRVSTHGLGDAMQVGDNSSPKGQQKDRRVEVQVR